MFWLEVSRVQFCCTFDRVPQWQSHLDSIDIAFDLNDNHYDDGDDDDDDDDNLTESHIGRFAQIVIR